MIPPPTAGPHPGPSRHPRPVGILAAAYISPSRSVYRAARAVVLVVRAIPELILAVIFVAAIGLGPMAGALALAVGTIGFLGKLVADSIEEIPPGPIEAVRSLGGGWWDQLFCSRPWISSRKPRSSMTGTR